MRRVTSRWHVALPFLVAVAPAFYIWSLNAAQVTLGEATVAVLAAATVAAVLLGVCRIVTSRLERAAFAAAVLLVPIVTFGVQLDPVPQPTVLRWPLLLANVAAVATVLIATRRRDVTTWARFATVGVALFIGTTIPGIVSDLWIGPTSAAAGEQGGTGGGEDVYYIVLDGYGRDDVLAEMGFDNGPFLAELAERGFQIATDAHSNYAMTGPSLASALNMRYLDADEDPIPLLQRPRVVDEMRDRGYEIVHVATPWHGTRYAPMADRVIGAAPLGEFTMVVFRATLPGRFVHLTTIADAHRAALDGLAGVAEDPDPTFTFAHILLPHPPWVFDRDGTVVESWGSLGGAWDDPSAYLEQVEYVNGELLRILDAVGPEAHVVIQGDHGPAFRADAPDRVAERMSILAAYRIGSDVPASMTPVNTFRVLLELPTLPDRSFYSWTDIEGFVEVTDELD